MPEFASARGGLIIHAATELRKRFNPFKYLPNMKFITQFMSPFFHNPIDRQALRLDKYL
jgi:hypothetical protein